MEKAVERKFREIVAYINFGPKIESTFLRKDIPAGDRHFGSKITSAFFRKDIPAGDRRFGVHYEKCIIGGEGLREIGYEPSLDARIELAESIIEKKEGEPVKGSVIVARAYLYPNGSYADLITRCLLLSFPSDPRYGQPAVGKQYTGWRSGHLNVMPVSGVGKVLDEARKIYGVLSKDRPFKDVYAEVDAVGSDEKTSLDGLLSELRINRKAVNTLRALKRTV